MKPAILIHGPTASGKTQLAVKLAKMQDGEVVNADSMQVYKDLRVLSARPSEDEMNGVPHHLFGTIDAAVRYSTGRWLEDARAIICDIQRRGKAPIIVGGTGLYLMALVRGLTDVPPIPEDCRAEVKSRIKSQGTPTLHEDLMTIDPETATHLKPNDRQRVARAYEVWLATGKPLSAFHKSGMQPVLGPNEWLGVALTPPRTRLYRRIDRRFGSMLIEGAMDEARAMAARDLDPELPAMKAHGMPWLLAFLRGDISAEDAAEHAQRDTRRYAKRQFTWIANQFPFWPRIPSMEIDKRTKVIHALYKDVDAPVWNS